MFKYTPSGVERSLKSSINGFHESAASVKKAHRVARQKILDDKMTSDLAKKNQIKDLDAKTRSELDRIRSEQESYVRTLRGNLERELRGEQPTDANSVLLRRDAADRARRITNEKEALAVLGDAVHNGDESMTHAVGYMARQSGWVDVSDAYRLAQPGTADVAAALAFVEDATTDVGYNLGSQMAYADPVA